MQETPWANSNWNEHPYALFTQKGRALEVGTVEREGHLCVIMRPFGTHLVKGAMKGNLIFSLSSPGMLPWQHWAVTTGLSYYFC